MDKNIENILSEYQTQEAISNFVASLFSREALEARNKPWVKRIFTLPKHKTEKIDETLPQIILPHDKISTIIEWYNDTIRFEKDIPETYKEGYIILDYKLTEKYELDRKFIRDVAAVNQVSVYDIKDAFNKFVNMHPVVYLYFNFQDKIYYSAYYEEDNKLEPSLGGTIPPDFNEELKDMNLAVPQKAFIDRKDMRELDDECDAYYKAIIKTVMWYVAVSGVKTRYVYEVTKSKPCTGKNNPSPDYKYITSTIYDLTKVKRINIDKLNQRKKGWTYSHSFEVHGHFRHYKNGKVIFIKPFVKGKQSLKNKKIILKPKEDEI